MKPCVSCVWIRMQAHGLRDKPQIIARSTNHATNRPRSSARSGLGGTSVPPASRRRICLSVAQAILPVPQVTCSTIADAWLAARLRSFRVCRFFSRGTARRARTREQHACAIMHPSRNDVAFRTAGVSPAAPLNFVPAGANSKSKGNVQNASRRPALQKPVASHAAPNGTIAPSSFAGHGMPCPY